MRVVFIDPDLDLAAIYQERLKKEGIEILAAEDGKQGLALVKKNKPNLILLEMILPHLSGLEFIKQVKKSKILSQIPILILTNLAQKEDIRKSLELGAAAYFLKPYTKPEEIGKKIKEIISH